MGALFGTKVDEDCGEDSCCDEKLVGTHEGSSYLKRSSLADVHGAIVERAPATNLPRGTCTQTSLKPFG